MFAAVSSPWSANDQGQPLVIMVEVDSINDVPEALGKSLALEANYMNTSATEEDIDLAMSTLALF